MNENSQISGNLDRIKTPLSDAIEEEKKQHHQNYAEILNFSMNRSPAIVTRAEENTNNLQNLDGVVVDRKEEEIAPVEN